jgi:hypothetical protein
VLGCGQCEISVSGARVGQTAEFPPLHGSTFKGCLRTEQGSQGRAPAQKTCIGRLRRRIYLVATAMENRFITSAYPPQHSGHKPPTTLLILFEIISLPVLARFSYKRRANKLLFWGLVAVMATIAAMYFLMFRDVSLRPA